MHELLQSSSFGIEGISSFSELTFKVIITSFLSILSILLIPGSSFSIVFINWYISLQDSVNILLILIPFNAEVS